MTQLHVHLHLLDCCRDHACQYGRHKILTYKFVCQALYETPCPVFFLLSDEKYGWNGCRASSLDAPGDAKRSRRIRTVDYSKPGGEAPFSVPAMSGMAGRSASSDLSCLLLPAFPACCLLPFLPIASCSTTTVCCLSSAARLQLWTLSSVLALLSFATCSKAEEHSHGLACGRLLCFLLAGMLQTSLLQC